ncbi:heme exporter protein CcmD [Pseudoalteromonas citrea]|uniref:Heme exporter protein D n=1 Tax=Pseudoalteromonas citrea TaxID=43655 RepID=A0A5S3XVX1_9GAMM|nr:MULTISPECIES: heme exporter protein CcmD [Pseudoalteromonas]RJE75804.1 heme exporter protein CcmD [Pseudoalteromonas sp. MSK9-3]TMP43435.1 heme exporter protein CcmD [Pseudoalteromonas citrea]TMP62166.1 heme exporter protein CcmD [Pseudoalteromonas citrea]
MQFESFSDFIAMGGYGFYVWLSYGSCAFVLLSVLLSSLHDAKQLKQQVKLQIEREARIKKAQQEQAV